MTDRDKTREQLLREVSDHRRWLGEMNTPEARLKLAVQALEESGEDSLSFARDLPDAFFLFNREHRIVSCNKACLDLFGYAEGELESGSIRQIQESDKSFARFQQTSDFSTRSRPFRKTEGRFVRKDGAVFPAETIMAPIAGDSGAKKEILCLIRDIAACERTENVLRESEAGHRDILDSIEEGYFEVDLAGTLIFINDSLCKITGREREALLGMNYREYTVSDNAKSMYSFFNEIYQTGKPAKLIDQEIVTYKGETKFLQMSASLMRNQDGQPSGFRGILRDVTNRKQSEAALRESEKKYRMLFESATDAIFLMEGERFIDCNPRALIMFGCAREEIVGEKPEVFSPAMQPDGEESSEKAVRKINLALDGSPQFFEWRHCRKDGTEFDTEVSLNCFELSGRAYLLAIVRDVTARKLAEEALRESEQRFRSIFDLCPEAIVLSDAETGRLIDVNEKFCERTKFTRNEVVGRTSVGTGMYSDENRKKFLRELEETGEVHGLEMDFAAKDGSVLNVLMFSRIIRIRGRSFIFNIFLDMTERKRLEEQLQYAQKMKAVATLAGGIAHEFNNALAALGGNLDLLEICLPADPYMQNRTRAMKDTIRRMVNLTNQLTAYAQGGEQQANAVSLSALVESVLKKMRGSVPPTVKIEKHFAPHAPGVQADFIQMQMVVSAILNNAMEALNGGGRICISTRDVDCDGDAVADHAGLQQGRYGCLIIEDNGVGMSEDTKSRIFDPFFSTKFQGRGLGMAAVYGIIKNHNGWLTVDSRQGEGSTVSIYLPAADA
jgi:two-component system, cell cycle sensor histidine kinase and response regulator CckA